jgi:hypothetical protein
MRFSVLHISDLHRDLRDEVANGPLLDSLLRDIEHYNSQNPPIARPSVCVVSGDLIYGVKPDLPDPDPELDRQYNQAVEFLIGLADKLFDGDRARLVLLPGNHDVSYPAVIASSTRIDIPAAATERRLLTDELFAPMTRLRWSWSEVCFYRITDHEQYEQRLSGFARAYEQFYQGARFFRMTPEDQFEIFDYPDLGLSIVALNSCYRNDPLQRAGGFQPTALSTACREMRSPNRAGWLLAASWHHSVGGGPFQNDYLDSEFLQLLMDSGVSLGFHGHQHSHDCVDERYRLGPGQRKMTIVSASTLCAEPRNLKPGVPRGYNVVELDTDVWTGRTHSRHMVNNSFNLPVWGPGLFYATGKSYVDFELCKPLASRPGQLDRRLALERADQLLGNRNWADALQILADVKDAPLARPMILTALTELADDARTVAMLWPPSTSAEIVLVGAAVLNRHIREEAKAFLEIDAVSSSTDASVADIKRRFALRWSR